MAEVHPSAIVDPGAELGEDVEVGPFSIIIWKWIAIIPDTVSIGVNPFVGVIREFIVWI